MEKKSLHLLTIFYAVASVVLFKYEFRKPKKKDIFTSRFVCNVAEILLFELRNVSSVSLHFVMRKNKALMLAFSVPVIYWKLPSKSLSNFLTEISEIFPTVCENFVWQLKMKFEFFRHQRYIVQVEFHSLFIHYIIGE